jgi:hypothetical protein
MAKPTAKRTAKSTPKPPNGPKTTPNQLPSALPSPYTTPSPTISTFLDNLEPSHVYLFHIDTHPPAKKRQIYAIAAAMNILIALVLLWRAYVAIPTYMKIGLSMLGYDNEETVNIGTSDMGALIEAGMRRTFMFVVDYALAVYLLPWPMDFFMGNPASPTKWRWNVRFEDKEIVVRKSRRWDKTLGSDWLEQNNTESPIYTEKIMPAIQRDWIAKKTGYLMMDKCWDLDYPAMISAHALVAQAKATLSDFQKAVAVYSSPLSQWLIWPVYRLDEGGQEEGRRRIVAFKDKLTAMGKENLFFEWIELIQYESAQPGGFTSERQRLVMERARELFEQQGVDFETFWEEIGGARGMPGLEDSGL